MARDLQPANKKNCYTCIQWQGARSLFKDQQKIKVDVREAGNCALWHRPMRGNQVCEHHDFLRF